MSRLALLLSPVFALAPAAALAQGAPTETEIAERAVARACLNMAGRQIERARLEQALRIEARLNTLEGDVDLSTPEFAEAIRDRANSLRGATAYLQQELALEGSALAAALAVEPPPPPRTVTSPVNWLFGPQAYRLTCAGAKPASPPSFPAIGTVVVRGSAEELDDVGDDRLSAGAARMGWERLRTTTLAGEATRTNTLLIDAAVGLATGNTDAFGMVYADYSLSRVRTQTEPEPTPEDDDGRADDVDALELGLLGTVRPATWLRTTGQLGVVFDAITDARTMRGGLTFVPITGGRPDLGFCNLNAFKAIGLGIESRCTVAGEVDLRYVLRAGTATFDDADTLLALGGVIGLEFRRSLDLSGEPQDGLVGNLSFRYLPMVDGNGPDIKRVEGSLTYRWWADDLGFDLGLTYADGIESKSLADENRVGFTFGVIY